MCNGSWYCPTISTGDCIIIDDKSHFQHKSDIFMDVNIDSCNGSWYCPTHIFCLYIYLKKLQRDNAQGIAVAAYVVTFRQYQIMNYLILSTFVHLVVMLLSFVTPTHPFYVQYWQIHVFLRLQYHKKIDARQIKQYSS